MTSMEAADNIEDGGEKPKNIVAYGIWGVCFSRLATANKAGFNWHAWHSFIVGMTGMLQPNKGIIISYTELSKVPASSFYCVEHDELTFTFLQYLLLI